MASSKRALRARYTDNGNGTITDNNTGLMWEKLSDEGSIHDKDDFYTWTTAVTTKIAALNSGSFGGHADWRLPNINELQSLANYDGAYPFVFSAFNTSCAASCTVLTCSCTQSRYYWSATTKPPLNAWLFGFDEGDSTYGSKDGESYVRAVRAGS